MLGVVQRRAVILAFRWSNRTDGVGGCKRSAVVAASFASFGEKEEIEWLEFRY